MFGTLFDEETRNDGIAEPPTYFTASVESNVPSPRPGHSLCGLNNQGTTCYLNSLIQTLFFTPEFRDAILELSPQELGLKGDGTSKDKVRVIIVELQRLFARLLWVDTATTSTTALTESFGWKDKEAFQQHDAQELMRILFDAIHTSLVGTSCSSLISDLYGGSTVDKITCKSCGNISEKTGFFLDVNITVTGYNSLNESLSSSFIENETMTGINRYLCDKCNCHVDAAKETKIRSLPPILVFSLLRLGYDTVKKQRFKEIGRFEFPMEINMSPFCEKEMLREEVEYELFAVLIHSGSSYCGHYNVYIQDIDHIGIWQAPAAKEIIKAKVDLSPNHTKKETSVNWKPMDLVTMILQKFGCDGVNMEVVQNEIIKETGSGWNKLYKKRNGSLVRFLLKNSDLFSFCEKTKIVKLKQYPEYINDNIDIKSFKELNIDENPVKTNVDHENEVGMKIVTNGIDSQSKYWFDINDSSVTPILVEDIKEQFCGRSSAYMLFYRRKVLREKVKSENLIENCPRHLEDFVKQENDLLWDIRKECEKSINQVTILVHFGNKHFVDNGILQLTPNELSVVEMNIDKRMEIICFYNEILQNFGDICRNLTVMHKCKKIHSGFHLYDDLLVHENSTLEELGLVPGSRVFLWNGNDINGVPISIGVENEPISLHVVIEKEIGSSEANFAFPVSITLSALLLTVGEQMEIPAQDLSVSRIISGKSIRLSNCINEENTLQELQICDGDYLFLDVTRKRSKINYSDVNSNDSRLIVKIENRCQELADPSTSWPIIDVQIEKTALVSELKIMTVSKLSLNENRSYRFRMQSDPLGYNPPLHENQSVENLGSILQSSLILEEGVPPMEQQITITYVGNFGSGDCFNEVIVNSDITVRECLQTILHSAGVEGGEWYLQRYNCFNELSAVLSKADATLASEGIKHGDHLYVREGHLVPYGYLSFVIELYPSLIDKTTLPGKHWTWVMDRILTCHKDKDSVANCNGAMSAILGEVEISAEATLENLKQQILTLPLLDELELYSQPQFIRLRLLKSGRPSTILRGHQNTLKKLKLVNQSRLCVQILSSPEDLSFNTLVIEIVQKIAKTNKYTDPIEILWDTQTGNLNCLRHTIANQLYLTENCLRLAKYIPDKFDWLVLTSETQSPTNYKSFKRKCKGVDLRNDPYSIKDGDTIAIQDSSKEANQDFSSEDDIVNRQRLEEEKANKQKLMCLAQKQSKPEVGIKIKVGDFSEVKTN